jgi:hypothetical protein
MTHKSYRTIKRVRSKTAPKSRKHTHKNRKSQNAGGLITTSNSERIIKLLTKLNTISKEQGKEILTYSKTGNKKIDKINLFVDKVVHILLANLYEIWKTNKTEILRNNPDKTYSELISNLNSLSPQSDKIEYKKLHEIYLILHKLGKQNRDDFAKKLDNTTNGLSGSKILEALYQLNDNWINEGAISTLKDPKFADLYRLWFNKPHQDWLDRNFWWMWLLS